jgi:hypothetical protein
VDAPTITYEHLPHVSTDLDHRSEVIKENHERKLTGTFEADRYDGNKGATNNRNNASNEDGDDGTSRNSGQNCDRKHSSPSDMYTV